MPKNTCNRKQMREWAKCTLTRVLGRCYHEWCDRVSKCIWVALDKAWASLWSHKSWVCTGNWGGHGDHSEVAAVLPHGPWGALLDSLPGGASGKEPTCQHRRHKRREFSSWFGKIPWRRAWQPGPVFLSREPQGQRSLGNCSPWGRRVQHDWRDLARTHVLSWVGHAGHRGDVLSTLRALYHLDRARHSCQRIRAGQERCVDGIGKRWGG